MEVDVQRYAPAAVPPRKSTGTTPSRTFFISGLPLPNLTENAPLVGVVKRTDEQTGVCALSIVLAL